MTKTQIIQMANKMDREEEWAVLARARFLEGEILKEQNYRNLLRKSINESTRPITSSFLRASISTSNKLTTTMESELSRITAPPNTNPESITDDDVENARLYPIDRLIDLKFGRCKAFCHDGDSEMTMSHNLKTNKLYCFKCNDSFNPIDLLIDRDSMSFIDAVKYLR